MLTEKVIRREGEIHDLPDCTQSNIQMMTCNVWGMWSDSPCIPCMNDGHCILSAWFYCWSWPRSQRPTYAQWQIEKYFLSNFSIAEDIDRVPAFNWVQELCRCTLRASSRVHKAIIYKSCLADRIRIKMSATLLSHSRLWMLPSRFVMTQYRVWSWWTPHLVGWFDRHHCHDDTALTLSDNACAKETFVDPREVIQDKREYCSHILCSVAVDPSRFIIAPLIWSWSWNHQRSEILERRRSSHNQPQGSLSWASCECTYSRLQLPIDYTDKYVEIKSFLARTHYWYQINLASLPRCFDKN
jgi:hypothetical protein